MFKCKQTKETALGKVLVTVLCAVACLMASVPVYAQEVSGKVPVTYIAQGQEAHLITVYVSGDGMVTIGDVQVRNSSEGFFVPEGETQTMNMIPDQDATLQKLVINGKSTLPKTVEQNTLDLVGTGEPQTIHVEFSSGNTGGQSSNGEQSSPNREQTNAPQTGDSANWFIYLGVIALCMVLLPITRLVRKKQSD